MTYQSWGTSIWSLCLNQQSISFTIQTQPVWTRITAIHTHCQENSLEKLCKATVYRGHRRECGLLGNTFHIHISQIGHISFSKTKKEKKTLHGDYNQRSVMFNLQGDLFLFPILHFPPFHSFMSPRYKLFTSRKWWRWDLKYLRWHSP